MNNRWNNYGLWASLFALLFLVCEGYGITSILPSNYEQITGCILYVLVFAGIVNDPKTESKWFLDDEEEE